MTQFNLIPESYILWRRFISDLRIYLLIILVLFCLGIAGRVSLQSDMQGQTNDISALHKSKVYLDSQHAEIRDLLDSKSILETRFRLMQGLKGRISIAQLFMAMDEALRTCLKSPA